MQIVRAVQDAEAFHVSGGRNLKTLQLYLDKQIDATFRDLGVTLANGNNKEDSITKTVHEYLKINDKHGRGGYDQRELPDKVQLSFPNTNNVNKVRGKTKQRRRVDVHEEDSEQRWITGLGPIGPPCQLDRIQLRKKIHYEDKFMCSYSDLVNNDKDEDADTTDDEDEDEEDCDMMSIGSNDQWGFESKVTGETKCRTHTFDCTLPGTGPKRKPNTDRVQFYPYCIAAQDDVEEDVDDTITENTDKKKKQQRKFLSYASMWKMTGMKHPPRLLKMDVEGFEYDVLTSMMGQNDNNILPEQINVELHYATRMYDLPWMLRSRQASEISMLVGHMYLQGGYMPVSYNWDPGCASCVEVSFVKVLC